MAFAKTSSKQSSLILPQSSVELHELIGSGGHSKVWRATYIGKLGQKISVAAKQIPSCSVEEDTEIQVMEKMNHKHVIQFYGVWKKNDKDIYIIMELATRGDLRNFLNKCKESNQRLTHECMWKWIYEAACALQYLMSLKHSHRDVKSLNFLIMDDFTLKLGDLGLAMPLATTQRTGQKGTCRWMAPEVIQDQKRSPKSDIFSFGIVAWEIVTMGVPYDHCKSNFNVMSAVCAGERPTIPEGCPDILCSLMTSCWNGERSERPDIQHVCQTLLPYQQASVSQFVEPSQTDTPTGAEQPAKQNLSSDVEMHSVSPFSSSGVKTLPSQHHLVEDAETGAGVRLSSDEHGVPMEVESEMPTEGLQVETQELTGTRPPVQVRSAKKSTIASMLPHHKVQYYRMRNKPHGLCVIINNMDFTLGRQISNPGFKDRKGSDVDAGKLKNLFESLNYQVDLVTDLTASKMYDLLDSKRQLNHSQYDCFICCILTHGTNGEVYGCDGKPLAILKLTGLFTADICNTLSGKPKVFIFESCQGQNRQGTTLEHDGLTITEKESIPNESDFVFGYATVPGAVAYRHTTEGSWYIRSLVETIHESHTRYDVLTLLTMVNRNLSRFEDGKGNKQTASVFNTLRKKLYLCDHPEADSGLQTV